MSRTRILTTTALAVAAVAATVVAAGSASSDSDTAGAGAAQLRKAIAKYADVQVAVEEGFVPLGGCVESPMGGMGIHYGLPPRLGAPIHPTRPAILLYEPTSKGLRLAGAEFFARDADQDPSTIDDRPSIFGVPFDGPMPEHEPGMGWHYDLHVWTDKANPAGTYATWNRKVSC